VSQFLLFGAIRNLHCVARRYNCVTNCDVIPLTGNTGQYHFFYARQQTRYSVYMLSPVRLSVLLSDGWIIEKRLKLGCKIFTKADLNLILRVVHHICCTPIYSINDLEVFKVIHFGGNRKLVFDCIWAVLA